VADIVYRYYAQLPARTTTASASAALEGG
jgi:hypothetical protein